MKLYDMDGIKEDLNQIALRIVEAVDYDIYVEVKNQFGEVDILEKVKDILYDFEGGIVEDMAGHGGS